GAAASTVRERGFARAEGEHVPAALYVGGGVVADGGAGGAGAAGGGGEFGVCGGHGSSWSSSGSGGVVVVVPVPAACRGMPGWVRSGWAATGRVSDGRVGCGGVRRGGPRRSTSWLSRGVRGVPGCARRRCCRRG